MSDNFRAGIAVSVALVLSTIIASSVFLKARKLSQSIQVTGSAKKRIKSDLMIWKSSVTVEGPTLPDTYQKLTKDVGTARAFLVSKGVPEDQIVISSVQTITMRRRRQNAGEGEESTEPNGPITGYQLRQALEVRSGEVEKITAVSREVTELINRGILMESEAPQYLYTKLADTKVGILADAAKDALARARQIASSTGSEVGEVRSADMGVLQITPADSTDVSGYGVNDTTSLDKDVTAVLHVTFALD